MDGGDRSDDAMRQGLFNAMGTTKEQGHHAATRLSEAAQRHADAALLAKADAALYLNNYQVNRTLCISQAFRRIWGLDAEAVLDDPMIMMDAIHEDDHGRIAEALGDQFRGGIDVRFRIDHPETGRRWLRDRSRAFPTGHPWEDHQVGTVVDITPEMNAVTALREALDVLRAGAPDEDPDVRAVLARADAAVQDLGIDL